MLELSTYRQAALFFLSVIYTLTYYIWQEFLNIEVSICVINPTEQ